LGLDTLEISDGSMVIQHDEKCELIQKLSKNFRVLSEVGSKEEGILISPNKWIRMMKNELQAGSWKVIAEARESGTVGIYRPNGSAHVQLIRRILANVALEDILWEAPKKPQQVWFLKQFGANVNLGNIGPEDLIPLECLRLGLRGDTFFEYLPQELAEGKRQVISPVEND
jgi:phosphosulfolactate synthase